MKLTKLLLISSVGITLCFAQEPKKDTLTDAAVINVLKAHAANAEDILALRSYQVLQLQQDSEYMRLTLAAQVSSRNKQAADAAANAMCTAGFDMEKMTCKLPTQASSK